MPPRSEIQNVEFGGPATYRIVVQGVVGKGCGSGLGGLETLYGLHLPILKVEKIEARATEA